MRSDQIRKRIDEKASHFTFLYHGVTCGIDPYSDLEYDMWYGDKTVTVNSIEEVMNSPFFAGKSLTAISNDIQIQDF